MRSEFTGLIFAAALSLFPVAALSTAHGQAEPPDDAKSSKSAIVVFVNGCETALPERWKASLDFRIGEKLVAADIRIGERSPAVLLTKDQAGKVTVFAHAGEEPLATVAIPFASEAHYVAVATGTLNASPAGVDVSLISESKELAAEIGSRCRVVLFNTIKAYPVAISLGKSKAILIAPLTETVIWPSPGEQELEISFPYRKKEPRAIRSALLGVAGQNQLLVVHASAERGDRPAITRTSSARDRSDIADVALAVKEASEQQPPEPPAQ